MSMLPRVAGVLAVLIAVPLALAWAVAWRSPMAPADPRRAPVSQAAVEKGAALAAIGNCITCHTRQDGSPYAGGRAIDTPFGRIHATNITPDAETGIGTWSQAAFLRAVREGVSADGRHLYPAFPYDHMAKATEDDVNAVYAFLMTRRAVRAETPANDLAFPYNVRMLVAGWKLLYMEGSTFEPVPGKSAEWNRGAYLVEGFAHCGSCHTPRGRFGAEIKYEAYSGGTTDGWTAPALNAKAPAAAPWTADRLYNYLRRGSDPMHGTVTGPMSPVVHNLAGVADADIRAMAVYVADIAAASKLADGSATAAVSRARGQIAKSSGAGAAIYAGACAGCHGEAGRAPVDPALNLALSSAVRVGDPTNLVRIVRDGIAPPIPAQGGYMPPFGATLTDKQMTDLVTYIRATFSEGPPFAGLEQTVARARRGG